MAVKIYSNALPDNPYSQEGAMTNPVRESFDGREGGSVERLYYVRNDDATYWYSGLQVYAVSTEGRNIVDGADGFGWKLSAGSEQPSVAEWENVDYGNTIAMSALYNTNTYLPFWVRYEIPRGADVNSYGGTIFRIDATQYLV